LKANERHVIAKGEEHQWSYCRIQEMNQTLQCQIVLPNLCPKDRGHYFPMNSSDSSIELVKSGSQANANAHDEAVGE